MFRSLTIALTLAGLAGSALALPRPQEEPNPGGGVLYEPSLLFTTRGSGFDLTSSGTGNLLSQLGRLDIGTITPNLGASAETFLAQANYNVVHGDKDCDGVLYDATMGGAIDAITVCGDTADARFPRFPNVFVSVKETIGTSGSTAVMTPGDVASPRLGGGYAYLIREDQIRSVFDIPAEYPIDVDAVAQDGDGTLYLSLEQDVMIRGGTQIARDGDLLMIAAADLVWDGCQIVDTFPSTGTIAVFEATWDAMVANSNVSDSSGAAVTTIVDFDGISLEGVAGSWASQGLDGTVMLPHFLFCGQSLNGAAVLSSQFGGTVAVVNGRNLADVSPTATLGDLMGLQVGTAANVRPLDGLSLIDHQPTRLVADLAPALPAGPGMVSIEWGGADPFGPTALLFDVGTATSCGVMPGVTIPNPGFGYLFCLGGFTPIAIGPADANGWAHVPFVYTGGIPAGTVIVLQPVARLSAFSGATIGGPALMQF
ncbi:MAG: hypothetical protein ACYTG2_11010 [Planctomycetota bacterium]|jgi:hypothetical protein